MTNNSTFLIQNATKDIMNALKVRSKLKGNGYHLNEVFAIVMLPIIIIGIIGNSLSIYAYSRNHMSKSSVGFLLLSLSVCDLIVLVTALPTYSIYKIPFFPGYNEIGSYHTVISAFSIVYLYPIGSIAKMCSQYIMLLISVERWFAVCRPLQVQVWCTLGNSIRAMFYIVILSVVFNCSRFLEFTANLSTGVVNQGLSHSKKNSWYFVLYYGIRSIFFDALIPCVVISITNIQVVRQLKRSSEERKMLTTQQKKDKNTTTMLLTLVIMYAVCHLFNTSLKLINLVFRSYAQFQFKILRFLHHLSNLLLVSYSMSTFFIYLLFSVKYRQIIIGLMTCRNDYDLAPSSRANSKVAENSTPKTSASHRLMSLKSNESKDNY